MTVLNLTIADVDSHCEMLRKWIPVYCLGSFNMSESREREYLNRFIETFGDKEPKDKGE